MYISLKGGSATAMRRMSNIIMGSVESKPAKNIAVIFKAETVSLDIDVQRPIKTQLKQLLYWRLIDIRRFYEGYQRRSEYPFLDANMFRRIMPFTHTTSQFIFDNLRGPCKYISIFELMSILVLSAFATYTSKMRFIYSLFDFDASGTITKVELMTIYESVVQGWCKLTEQQPPNYQHLEKFTRLLFLKSQGSEDKDVLITDLVQEIQGNSKAMDLFKRFEPAKYDQVKEEFAVFKPFQPYDERTISMIYGQLKRAYLENNYLEADMEEFKRQIRLGTKRGEDLNSAEDEAKKYISQYLSQSGILKRQSALVRSSSRKRTPSQLPSLQKLTLKVVPEEAPKTDRKRHPSQQRLIFIHGDTISRQQIFNLFEYFNVLSNKNDAIKVREFFEAFESTPCMRKLVSSVYGYLDEKKKGEVTFEDFLRRIYPAITKKDMMLINHWVDMYRHTYDDAYLKKQETAGITPTKKMLPSNSLNRVKEIFSALDLQGKGYLVFEDFKRNYRLGYTITELQNLFRKLDATKSRRIYIYEFAEMLLPDDFTIQGIETLKRQDQLKEKQERTP